jgi:hypothetical protein
MRGAGEVRGYYKRTVAEVTAAGEEEASRLRPTVCIALVAVLARAGAAHAEQNRGAAPRPTKVFILAGQSNMVGQGKGEDVPAEVAAAAREKVLILDRGRWRPLVPGQRFGPEITFGVAMAKAWPAERIGLIKVALGGSSLNEWKPDAKPRKGPRNLYSQMLDAVKAARADTAAEIVAMVWKQGGAEARRDPKGYFLKLSAFIVRVRTDVGNEALPFVFGRLTLTSTKFPGAADVRQAQERSAREVPHTAMLDFDAITKWTDGAHYDTKGQLEAGRRFGTALRALIDKERSHGPSTRPQASE